jgi:hypothetical protein
VKVHNHVHKIITSTVISGITAVPRIISDDDDNSNNNKLAWDGVQW